LFYIQTTRTSKKEVKTEQTDQDSQGDEAPDDLVVTSVSQISVPSPSTIEVEKEQEQGFIFEILFEQAKSFPNQTKVNLSSGKLFQHLFRVIISPNAP
jgi:hypothetical protein